MNAKRIRRVVFVCIFGHGALLSPMGFSQAEATSSLELVGSKAPALGGAFCGDPKGDASSLVYNPATLARSSGFNVNASVTGYTFAKQTLEKTYGGKDVEFSGLGANSFLGFVNPLELKSLANLAVAFYVPQNSNVDLEFKLGKAPEFQLERMYSSQKTLQQTYSGVLGMGWALSNAVSVGVSAEAFYLKFTSQRFLHFSLHSEVEELEDNSKKPILQEFFMSDKFNAAAWAIGARMGVLWNISETLSWGATLSKSRFVQTEVSGRIKNWTVATYEDGTVVPPSTLKGVSGDLKSEELSAASQNKNRNPFQRFPLLLRTGLSWEPTETTKINSDVFVSNRNIWREIEPNNSYRTTANLAVGVEQKLPNNYFVAGGVFSDFDENPPFSTSSKDNSNTHIDHGGISLALGISTPEAESALTFVQIYGKGKTIPINLNKKRIGRDTSEQSTTAQFSLTKKL